MSLTRANYNWSQLKQPSPDTPNKISPTDCSLSFLAFKVISPCSTGVKTSCKAVETISQLYSSFHTFCCKLIITVFLLFFALRLRLQMLLPNALPREVEQVGFALIQMNWCVSSSSVHSACLLDACAVAIWLSLAADCWMILIYLLAAEFLWLSLLHTWIIAKPLQKLLWPDTLAGLQTKDLTPTRRWLLAPLTVGLALSCGRSFQSVPFVAGEAHHIVVVEAIACGAAIYRAARVATRDSLSWNTLPRYVTKMGGKENDKRQQRKDTKKREKRGGEKHTIGGKVERTR